jgi:hypothetical protein
MNRRGEEYRRKMKKISLGEASSFETSKNGVSKEGKYNID